MSPRDASLLALAVAAAQNRTDDLRERVLRALANGITAGQILAILDQAALSAGHSLEYQLTILGDALGDTD